MAKNNNYSSLIHLLIILLVVLFIVNASFTLLLSSKIKTMIKQDEENRRPANIGLTIISANCNYCFDINNVIKEIKSLNVNVGSERTLSQNEANDLIKRYNIKKLPAVIITGEINKTPMQFLTQKEDVLLFENLKAPYYDIEKSRVVGVVAASVINVENCENCFDVSLLAGQLKAAGVYFSEIKTYKENEAKELINKFKLDKLPALILSEDLKYYQEIADSWDQLGKIDQGNYILTKIIPPYKNLQTNKIEGLVKAEFISDKTCTECFDVKLYKKPIQNIGIKLNEEKYLDVSEPEAKELIKKYNINKLPVFILSEDAKIYSVYKTILLKVGKENSDGSYLFTDVAAMGNYKDLSTGEIIKQNGK